MDYKEVAKEWIDSMIQMNIAKHEYKVVDDFRGEDFVLYLMYQKKDVTEPGELSKELSLSTARIAKILRQLEDKKFLTREINLQDRRKIKVKLTKKGEEFIVGKTSEFIEKMAQIMALLGKEDTKEYLRITRCLAQIFSELES